MHGENPSDPAVAVLIPCFNEEAAIYDVITGFRAALPDAAIYGHDNNSTDRTMERALEAGAVLRREPRQGKGHLVRRMFADMEAGIYVRVDGDLTYEAEAAPARVDKLLAVGLDRVTGVHLVKSFPVSSRGFEIETELTVHALGLDMAVGDHPIVYPPRPEQSQSKLKTFADGFAILMTSLRLLQLERPLQVFDRLAPRFSTLIVSVSLAVAGLLSLFFGAILSAVAHSRSETRRLFYLTHAAPAAGSTAQAAERTR